MFTSKSVTATVSSVNYDSDNTIVTLITVFFPEGGGQSGDCGTLTKTEQSSVIDTGRRYRRNSP